MNLQEEIKKMAYELYERGGMRAGRELDNWLEAEKIIMSRFAEMEKAGKTRAYVPPQPEKKVPAKLPATKSEPQKIEAKKTGTKKQEEKKTIPKKGSKNTK